MEKNVWYVAPEVEVIEVEVEKGFAASPLENPEQDPEEGM